MPKSGIRKIGGCSKQGPKKKRLRCGCSEAGGDDTVAQTQAGVGSEGFGKRGPKDKSKGILRDPRAASDRLALQVCFCGFPACGMWVKILPNASPCARLTGRPNKLKRQRWHQRNDYCKAMPGEWVASAQKTPDFPNEFQQSIIKGQVTEAGVGGCPRVCD